MGGIIWLASYPKSGNTWLRAFLHNYLRDPDRPYDINRLSDLTVGDSQISWYQQIDNRPPAEYTTADIQRMRPLVHRGLAAVSPDSVIVKTHNALVEDEGHPMITLEVTAGAIYIVRNPLDVLISYSHHLGRPLDHMIDYMGCIGASTLTNTENVYELQGSWSENVETWTDPPNPKVHVMRYEDMLDAPLGAFTGLVEFLGLERDRQRIAKAVKLSSFKVLREQERRHGFRERPPQAKAFFREGRSGQWRKLLTPEQIGKMVATHRAQMARFGYVPEGY